MRAVITQNIDRLHERAGSRALVEVHGSIRTSSCLDCGTVVPFDDVAAVARAACPGLPGVRSDSQAGRGHVRRAAPRRGDRPRDAARVGRAA